MKLVRLMIGLSALWTTLVAGAIAYGKAFPSREIVFDLRSAGEFTAYRMDVRTHVMRVLPVESHVRNQEQWSPDGAQLAYLVEETGGVSIYVTDLSGQVPRLLMSGDVASSIVKGYGGDIIGSISDFTWSPDSSRIAVAGQTSLWMIDVAGKSPPVSFSPVAGGIGYTSIAWSPDGTRLAFASFATKEGYVYDISSGDMRRLGACTNHDWSPDGSHVVCENDSRVLVFEVSSGEVIRIGQGIEPAWSPDGDWIAFSRGFGGLVDLMLYNVSSGEVSTLLSNGTANLMSDWRPRT
jgi:Tol biopolymer transport system component